MTNYFARTTTKKQFTCKSMPLWIIAWPTNEWIVSRLSGVLLRSIGSWIVHNKTHWMPLHPGSYHWDGIKLPQGLPLRRNELGGQVRAMREGILVIPVCIWQQTIHRVLKHFISPPETIAKYTRTKTPHSILHTLTNSDHCSSRARNLCTIGESAGMNILLSLLFQTFEYLHLAITKHTGSFPGLQETAAVCQRVAGCWWCMA